MITKAQLARIRQNEQDERDYGADAWKYRWDNPLPEVKPIELESTGSSVFIKNNKIVVTVNCTHNIRFWELEIPVEVIKWMAECVQELELKIAETRVESNDESSGKIEEVEP